MQAAFLRSIDAIQIPAFDPTRICQGFHHPIRAAGRLLGFTTISAAQRVDLLRSLNPAATKLELAHRATAAGKLNRLSSVTPFAPNKTAMKSQYHIEDTSQIISPALVVFRDLVEENLRMMVAIAGDAQRLRPHCKTHKMREVVQMQLSQGIVKHKCATFAEAEMLATTGVQDVFLAYNLVGPNIARAVDFRQRFPDVTLSVTADHADPVSYTHLTLPTIYSV